MPNVKLIIDGKEFELRMLGPLINPSGTPIVYFEGNQYIGEDVPDNSKTPYEILSFIIMGAIWEIYRGINNNFVLSVYKTKVSKACYPSVPKDAVILSLKRLSDNEVFSVGDITIHGVIEKFFIGGDDMKVHYKDGSVQALHLIKSIGELLMYKSKKNFL